MSTAGVLPGTIPAGFRVRPEGMSIASADGETELAWLQWRRGGIGASEAAAVCGLSPWSSPYTVWLDKTGQLPLWHPPTEAMRWGNRLEPAVADAFAEEHDTAVTNRGLWVEHREDPWLRATLDGLAMVDDELCVVELKTSNGRDGAWDEGVPLQYQVQVQHQLLVTGLQAAYIAVLLGGSEYRSYRIDRDESAIGALLTTLRRFWFDHVVPRVAPAVDGSPATGDALRTAFAKAQPRTVLLPPEAEGLLQELRDAKAAIKDAEARETAAQNGVMALLADADQGAIGDQVVVTWKEQTSRRIDVERLRKERQEIAEEFTKEQTTRVLRLVRRRDGV